MGFNKKPKRGYKTPAAMGIPKALWRCRKIEVEQETGGSRFSFNPI